MVCLTKTYQAKLKPNYEAKHKLQFISNGCDEVYNYFLKKRIKADKKGRLQPTLEEQQKQLTQLKKLKKNKWLSKISAWTLQEVVKNRLPNAWKKYQEYRKLNSKAKHPRLKTENRWYDSFSVHQGGYRIKDNWLYLSQGNWQGKRQPKITIPFEMTNSLKGKPKTITISWKNNNWTLNIACEVECLPQIPLNKVQRSTGIDRNVRKLFANNEGWKYSNPKPWNKKTKQIKSLQQSLSRKQHKRTKTDRTKPSKNYLKSKTELRNLCQKLANQVKDRNHKLSRKLVNKFDLIAFEKLKPNKMVSKTNKRIGKWTKDGILKSCWGQLAYFTTYKVKETGKWCFFVNPHNTSKMCFECKAINNNLKDKEIFLCSSCGYKEDRDVNASKNILFKAQQRLGTAFSPLLSERV